MSHLTDSREDRKPKKRNPWDYADNTGVTVVGPAQVPAGMVTAPQPVQAQLAPATPNVTPQPFYPTPTQAAPDPNAVVPALVPQPQQPQSADPLTRAYQRIGAPVPSLDTGPKTEAQAYRAAGITPLTGPQRVNAAPSDITPVAPGQSQSFEDIRARRQARLAAQNAAPADTTPRTTLFAPDVNPGLAKFAATYPEMITHRKKFESLQAQLEKATKPSNKAAIRKKIAKVLAQSDARLSLIKKSYDAAQKAKIAKETKAAQDANAIKDAKKKAIAINSGARKQASAASEALTGGDPDEAIRLAQAAKEQYSSADNTIFTDLDQIIARAQSAKKAAAATKQKAAERAGAARIDAIKTELGYAEKEADAAEKGYDADAPKDDPATVRYREAINTRDEWRRRLRDALDQAITNTGERGTLETNTSTGFGGLGGQPAQPTTQPAQAQPAAGQPPQKFATFVAKLKAGKTLGDMEDELRAMPKADAIALRDYLVDIGYLVRGAK